MPVIKDRPSDKVPEGARRSTKWPAVRKTFLKLHPNCSVCGGKKKLEAHHKMPFHLNPALELNPENLIALCENKNDGVNCHLLVGHLGCFKSFNADVVIDADKWKEKIDTRPL